MFSYFLVQFCVCNPIVFVGRSVSDIYASGKREGTILVKFVKFVKVSIIIKKKKNCLKYFYFRGYNNICTFPRIASCLKL